ncbi:unnamed protein product [Sphagnum tenellum]
MAKYSWMGSKKQDASSVLRPAAQHLRIHGLRAEAGEAHHSAQGYHRVSETEDSSVGLQTGPDLSGTVFIWYAIPFPAFSGLIKSQGFRDLVEQARTFRGGEIPMELSFKKPPAKEGAERRCWPARRRPLLGRPQQYSHSSRSGGGDGGGDADTARRRE